MHIIIGGAYQGKKEYAIKCLQDKLGYEPTIEEIENGIILNLHLTIHKAIRDDFKGDVTEKMVTETTKKHELNGDLIITCDEVGMGVVPLERNEREYREVVGKILQELVKMADRVDRVVAGMPIRIK